MRNTVILLLSVLLAGCVSKKKHLEEVTLLKTRFETENNALSQELDGARGEIDRLELQLAERKGENNALVAMQDKLQARIDRLEAEKESVSNKASSTRKNLEQDLKKLEEEVARLHTLMGEVGALLNEWENKMSEIAEVVQDSLQGFDDENWLVEVNNGNAVVILAEAFIFRSNSVSRFEEDGAAALEVISEIISRYPNTKITVIAHTDNSSPRNYKDNWSYSAMRAASITRLLVEEFYVSANQVTAAAKGETAPIASNETSEGRARNRRLELVVSPLTENMVREVRRKLREGRP